MHKPGNRRHFGNSFISVLHSSKMICDKCPKGFTIDYFMDSLLVAVIIFHPREVKINRDTLIWLYCNTSGPMARWSFWYLRLDTSGSLIKYFRSSVAELWDSINIFVSIVELLITMVAKYLVS